MHTPVPSWDHLKFLCFKPNVCFILRIIVRMFELNEISSQSLGKLMHGHSHLKMIENWLSQTYFLVLQVVLPKKLILTGN